MTKPGGDNLTNEPGSNVALDILHNMESMLLEDVHDSIVTLDHFRMSFAGNSPRMSFGTIGTLDSNDVHSLDTFPRLGAQLFCNHSTGIERYTTAGPAIFIDGETHVLTAGHITEPDEEPPARAMSEDVLRIDGLDESDDDDDDQEPPPAGPLAGTRQLVRTTVDKWLNRTSGPKTKEPACIGRIVKGGLEDDLFEQVPGLRSGSRRREYRQLVRQDTGKPYPPRFQYIHQLAGTGRLSLKTRLKLSLWHRDAFDEVS